MRQRIVHHLRSRVGLGLTALGVVACGTAASASGVRHGDTLTDALVARFADEGMRVEPSSVIFVDGPPDGLAPRGVVFVGAVGDEPPEVRFAWVRGAGSTLLGVLSESNLSRTPGAAEGQLVREGRYAAYRVVARERVEAVVVLDLEGEPDALTRGWPLRARVQDAITNFQETGRFVGMGRRRYALTTPADAGELSARDGAFELALADGVVRFDPREDRPVALADRVVLGPTEKGMPGGITWIVDTVRNLSFVGPEPIAWLENRVYALKDRATRLRYRLFGADDADDDLAAGPSTPVSAAVIAELEAIGFPPPDLRPMIPDPPPGEGVWRAVVDDPFVGTYPNAAPAFAETSLRVDPDRPYARVFLVAIDARQVQLRAVSGTREPESANGAFGSGSIPREPATATRLVGAFNGGFQAMHGEFGMMADGVVYLPPKPYAATVGVMDDGRVVMGSWQGLPEGARVYTETAAMAQIPEGMLDFRQNLTSVVEGDTWNPWGRWYWGAAPVNAGEQSYVDRSGLCITTDGFVIYLWGESMGPEALGEAMKRARCARGMHLDMNSKHTQFEYYRVQPTSAPFPELGRARTESEFEQAMPDLDGFRVRGRLLSPRMEPQSFPRYVATDPRDFFYLELRPTLPGPNLADGTRFAVEGLPQPSYPWAFARASARGITWVRIDPSRAVPATLAPRERVVPSRRLAVLEAASDGPSVLYARTVGARRAFAVGSSAPEGAVVVLRGATLGPSSTARAALGVDGEGFLVYAERTEPGADLLAAMRAAGVSEALALDGSLRFAVEGGFVGADGVGVESRGEGLAFVERAAGYTEVLNPDVVPSGYASWGRIQDTRLRYIPEPGPRRFNQPH